MQTIMLNQTSNGNGTPAIIIPQVPSEYIYRTLFISGDLDGGALALSIQPELGGDFHVVLAENLTPVTIAVVGAVNLQVRGYAINLTLSAAGAGTDVTAILV